MNLPPLTVIEASAGTGKTFSLVTRLLRLIFAGVEPERIVALTFSRMAAGEIFNSFVERLSRAADGDAAAAEESERMGRALTRDDFRAMLRKVISRQHLSLIGTLDSFLMRVVRMIPLELGLEGEVSVMSDYRSPVERARLVGDLMMCDGDDAKAVFRDAFRLVNGSAAAKGFRDAFAGFVDEWHARCRDCASPSAWGDAATIWGSAARREVRLADVRAIAPKLASYSVHRGADTFIAAVAGFGGAIPANVPVCMKDEPLAAEAMRLMREWKIGGALKTTQGVYRLMRAYEAAYAAKVRARGYLTFDDMPRLLNSLGEGVTLPLEYRMDAKFDHWALDEFQDTSRSQWRALRNLIYENSQPGAGKSVFVVGDRKQSIYEWRGGDVRILGEQVERAKENGNELGALDESRRYLPAISRAVNLVFGESTIRGAFDMDHAPESATWKCREHVSHDKSSDGFVEVVQAAKAGRQAAFSDFFAPVENALNAVKPWERGITAAVLVRKNDHGEALLAHLKSRGVSQVVFEGESNVFDSPALAAMADLVRLAEHPDDEFAYAHVAHSPLAKALWPQGMPAAPEASAELLADFTRLGMTRKFRETREALKSIPDSWNDFTESRFEDFVKCAAEFEEMRDATMRLSDFAEFLKNKTRRDYAEPGMVRIMTMHQSKGLGFDFVIIPFYEHDGLVGPTDVARTGPLECEEPEWVLAHPGVAAANGDATLAAAELRREQVQRYNALCLDYVAMTRAKRALTLILHPANKTKAKATEPARFSDLVRMVGLQTNGDREWYLKLAAPKRDDSPDAPLAPPKRRPRAAVAKSRPSEAFFSGMKGDRLFADDFGAAAKRGSEIHAEYEKVEWLDAADAKDDFDRALVKPSPEATLWRERAYEIFADGTWQSGQFDRVEFVGAGAARSATVYDFKTNSPRDGESPDAFAERMREKYRGQMFAYRGALAALAAIPPERISLKLLLHATKSVAEVK